MTVKLHELIRLAYSKGYRVTEDGKVIGASGKELTFKVTEKSPYPRISFYCGKKYSKVGVYGIPIHHLAAYCFYGEAIFDKSVQIRHLNGDTSDVSKKNIVLGTPSQNQLDKPKESRVKAATKANRVVRELYGGSSPARKLTDEQVREIRRLLDSGANPITLSDVYGVHKDTIVRIGKRKSYRSVT